jgi:hypothetical protein
LRLFGRGSDSPGDSEPAPDGPTDFAAAPGLITDGAFGDDWLHALKGLSATTGGRTGERNLRGRGGRTCGGSGARGARNNRRGGIGTRGATTGGRTGGRGRTCGLTGCRLQGGVHDELPDPLAAAPLAADRLAARADT